MEQLVERLESCKRALKTLDDILATPFSVVVRDAAIQRFEYSFESLWKLLKSYLREREGIVCNSTKQCFREAQNVGLLVVGEVENCLAMTDDRNLTSHTYIEAVADAIYSRIPSHQAIMKQLIDKLCSRIGGG